MRLDKLLANLNYGSRKEVHALLKDGQVTVDGKVVRAKDYAVDPDASDITVCGEPVDTRLTRYIAFHKPAGYVTAVEDPEHPTVMELLPEAFMKMGVVPVGRLDKDTEGLLLLTNDGVWAHRIIHGKKKVKKAYRFTYSGTLDDDAETRIAEGLLLGDGLQCKPASLRRVGPGEAELILTEGKFHQVKRMVAACGGQVTYLKRIWIGSITLDDIPEPGMYRDLTTAEQEVSHE